MTASRSCSVSTLAIVLLVAPCLGRASEVAQSETIYEQTHEMGDHILTMRRKVDAYELCHRFTRDSENTDCTSLFPFTLTQEPWAGLHSFPLGLAFGSLGTSRDPEPGGLDWQEWEPCDQAPEWIEFEQLGRFHKVCQQDGPE